MNARARTAITTLALTAAAGGVFAYAWYGVEKPAEAEKYLTNGYLGLNTIRDRIPATEQREWLRRPLVRLIELGEKAGRAEDAKKWRGE